MFSVRYRYAPHALHLRLLDASSTIVVPIIPPGYYGLLLHIIRYIARKIHITSPQCGCLLLFAWYGPWDPRFINADDTR